MVQKLQKEAVQKAKRQQVLINALAKTHSSTLNEETIALITSCQAAADYVSGKACIGVKVTALVQEILSFQVTQLSARLFPLLRASAC